MYKITIFTTKKQQKNYRIGTILYMIVGHGTFNTECVARPALRVLGSNVSSSGHLTALCKQCVRAHQPWHWPTARWAALSRTEHRAVHAHWDGSLCHTPVSAQHLLRGDGDRRILWSTNQTKSTGVWRIMVRFLDVKLSINNTKATLSW